MGLLDTPFEIGRSLKVHSKGLELSLDAETDEELEEPLTALRQSLEPEEGTNFHVRSSFEVTDFHVRPSCGLDQTGLKGKPGKPSVHREPPASPPYGPQKRATDNSSPAPGGPEPLFDRLLRAANAGVRSRPVNCGSPSAPHSRIVAPPGSDGRLVDCEPLFGPCVLHYGHVAEEWRLELEEELDG